MYVYICISSNVIEKLNYIVCYISINKLTQYSVYIYYYCESLSYKYIMCTLHI